MSWLRYEIRLRPGRRPDDPIEASHPLPNGLGWDDFTSTELTERKPVSPGGRTLGELIELFATLDPDETSIEGLEYDLRDSDQHEGGRLLHRGLFGTRVSYTGSWLHLIPVHRDGISPEDNERFRAFVLRVPWALLTETDRSSAPYLALRDGQPCAITIQADVEQGDVPLRQVKLPPYPNVLLVFPTSSPAGDGLPVVDDGTQGDAHRKEIEDALLARYGASRADRIRTVRTFQEFKRSLSLPPLTARGTADARPFDPHIIYFYGHGSSRHDVTTLQFASTGSSEPDNQRIDQMAAQLRRYVARRNFPPVIWINACQGSAAPRDNVLRQLSPLAAAVIAMRTLAVVQDSRNLALTALPMIAVSGRAPQMALSYAIQALADGPLDTVQSARWATTAVAIQYELWSPLALEDRTVEERESAGDIPIRLDRSEALRAIEGHINGFLAEKQPIAPHAILWHGEHDDGHDIFEQRFVDFVAEAFPNWGCSDFRVELQAGFGLTDEVARTRDFTRAVALALQRRTRDAVTGEPDFLDLSRQFAALVSERPTLLTFRHGPLARSHCDHVLNYLKFWKALYSQLRIEADRTRIVLGFRFEGRAEPVFASGPGMPEQVLGSVPLDEIRDHLKHFSGFYRLGSGQAEAATEAEKLVAEAGSSLYRPLIFALQGKLGLQLWTKDETRPGDP